MGDPMLALRLTAGELYDVREALDVCEAERIDSNRMWLKRGCRFEEALALRDFLRDRRLLRTMGRRAKREAEG